MKKYDNHDIVVYDYLGKRFDSIIYSGSSDEHRDRAQIEEMYRYKHGIIYLGKGELHKTSKEIKLLCCHHIDHNGLDSFYIAGKFIVLTIIN